MDTPTALAFLWPHRNLDTDAVAPISIRAWSDRFEWRQDAWGGVRDTLQPVSETVAKESGDCEDYAYVAASWCKANDRPGVGLAVCFEGIRPTHVVAYDYDYVYSSGWIMQGDLGEFVERTEYDRTLTRSV